MPLAVRLPRDFVARLAVAGAAWLLPATARAEQGDRIVLRWAAPSGCPDAAAVEREVDRLLGSTARPAKPIEVSAAVSRDDRGGWNVHLETPGAGTTRVRELHGASCAAIADATALILAMMIDPAAALAAPPPAAAPSAEPPPSPPPNVAPEAKPPSEAAPPDAQPGLQKPVNTAPPARRAALPPPRSAAPRSIPLSPSIPLSFRALLSGGLDVGSLPGASAGFSVAGALLYGAQRFELGAALRPPRRGTVADKPQSGGDVDLITGFAATCRDLLLAPVELGPCVGLELGRLHASGYGVTKPGKASSFWAAIQADANLVYAPLSWAALALRLGAAFPLLRPQFVLDNVGPVHRPASLALRVSAGVELLFR